MSAAAILSALAHDGLSVTLTGENLRVVPASALTAEHRALIAGNRPALVSLLGNTHRTALDLIASINRCCAARGDDDYNRAALIAESARLSPAEQGDMRVHFDAESATWTRARSGVAP